eukprot:gnl/MRDRNA2_/MRDRNA2_83395_c1_seq3.p1 gnl/MRDRNA2_/MRDRNA2_83395_c1~~gnl/MRDRNA2_/MRDRNA2_83395_c1_seq3.p1  ORF type:complete len:867 (+),score=155.63 gnl/MRDRNA2_/MRDRNA2_83395_c1_seq3:123-2723(+)
MGSPASKSYRSQSSSLQGQSTDSLGSDASDASSRILESANSFKMKIHQGPSTASFGSVELSLPGIDDSPGERKLQFLADKFPPIKLTEAQAKENDSVMEKDQWMKRNEEFSQALRLILKLPLMTRLPRDKYSMLAACCTMMDFPAKAKIFTSQDVFAVVSGRIEVYIDDRRGIRTQVGEYVVRHNQAHESMEPLVVLGEGACFRQHHWFLNVTVVAVTPTRCMRIPQKDLEALGLHYPFGPNRDVLKDFGETGWSNMVSNTRLLWNGCSRNFFKKLLLEETLDVAAALTQCSFLKGQQIVTKGECGESLYVFRKGDKDLVISEKQIEASAPFKFGSSPKKRAWNDASPSSGSYHTKVSIDSKQHYSREEADVTAILGDAAILGDFALLFKETQPVTVTVKSDSLKALKMSRAHFDILDTFRTVLFQQRTKEKQPQIMHDDLISIGLLGCGAFASVALCKHRGAGKSTTLALKSVSKVNCVKASMHQYVFNERRALIVTDSHFIVKLHQAYDTPQRIEFLIDALLGGDLNYLYKKNKWHGSITHAKYYVASWVCALEHLHERYIICRGVKPEDCVLNSVGHMKVVDLGLVKFTCGKTYTLCGTPEFTAPEVLSANGYGKACDWWALGVLLFELMFGNTPFESEIVMNVYSKIMMGIEVVQFPGGSSRETTDIIKLLLKKDPAERLLMNGSIKHRIKHHPWFHAFDWPGLTNQTLKPPHVPNVKNAEDLSNFDVREEDMPKDMPTDMDLPPGWDSAIDPVSQREYYFNRATGIRQWDFPHDYHGRLSGDEWDDFAWTYVPPTPVELGEDNPEMIIEEVSIPNQSEMALPAIPDKQTSKSEPCFNNRRVDDDNPIFDIQSKPSFFDLHK